MSAFVFMPVWFWSMQRFGKRNTYVVGLLVRLTCNLSCLVLMYVSRWVFRAASSTTLSRRTWGCMCCTCCAYWVCNPAVVYDVADTRAATGGASLGSTSIMPWAMLPDVIDDIGWLLVDIMHACQPWDTEVRTYERNESIFYAFFVFSQKFAAVCMTLLLCVQLIAMARVLRSACL